MSKVVLRDRRHTFAPFPEEDFHVSWQAQHFGRVHLHFPWQAERFRLVVLRVFATRIVRAASSGRANCVAGARITSISYLQSDKSAAFHWHGCARCHVVFVFRAILRGGRSTSVRGDVATCHSGPGPPHSNNLPHFPPLALNMSHYTPHSTLLTSHSALYTAQLAFHICNPHSTIYTLHFALHTLHFTLCTLHFTLDAPHSTHFALHILYFLHSTLRTLHFTLDTLHLALHT